MYFYQTWGDTHPSKPFLFSNFCLGSSPPDTSQNDAQNEAFVDISNDQQCGDKAASPTVEEQPYACSSTLSKAAEIVLGLTVEVIQFDKARNRIKKQPQNNVYSDDYMKILAIIHTRVSKQRRILKEEITAWEKEYFANSGGKIPTYDDMMMNPSIEQIFKRLKYANDLLNKFTSCKT